jgi:hypothetical protein
MIAPIGTDVSLMARNPDIVMNVSLKATTFVKNAMTISAGLVRTREPLTHVRAVTESSASFAKEVC